MARLLCANAASEATELDQSGKRKGPDERGLGATRRRGGPRGAVPAIRTAR